MDKPKGLLLFVGGAENKGDKDKESKADNRLNAFEVGILNNLVQLVEEGHDPVIELITTASTIPEEMAKVYKDAFAKLGCNHVEHLNICTRKDTKKSEFLDRLINCNIVLFTGGDQLRLSSIFGGTEFLDILKHRYQNEHVIIAGTSAGAMVMTNTIIHGGSAARAHLKGEVGMSMGFGFIQNVIIDTHFDKRGRFNRLVQAVATQPGIVGIGLGEDTGMIVHKGTELTAIGSGSITIIDGKNILYNNIADIDTGCPISVENIRVHVMSNNDVYNLETRSFQGNDFKVINKNCGKVS
jgi:cyanophycinase